MNKGSFDSTPTARSDWPGKAVYVLVLVSAFSVALWLLRPEPLTVTRPPLIPAQATNPPQPQRPTVADQWHWPSTDERLPETAASTDGRPALPFSEKAVADALGKVELTESGDVVINKMALSALQTAFDALPADMSAKDLADLQEMIRRGLPGRAGEQTAKIVADYYGYRQALAAFNAQQPPPTDLDAERERLEQLAELRQQHLGPVVATRFFAQDEAYERYIFERRRIESNLDLSADEKAAQHATLQQNLLSGAFFFAADDAEQAEVLMGQAQRLQRQGASEDYIRYIQMQTLGLYTADALPRTELERQDWRRRYARVQQERRAILESALAESDKKAQLDQLMHRLLTEEEIVAARAYEMN